MPGRRALRCWALALLLLAIGALAALWAVGSFLMRPSPSHVAAAVAPAQDFQLRASDGLMIAATYWPGKRPDAPAILLLHGNGASRAAVASTAEWLSRQGYAALTIDFRGHGESARASHSFGLFEARDAAAAFAWLKRKQQGGAIVVLGISLGGASALLGERGPLPAQGFILQAVYPDIRHAIRNRLVATGGLAVFGWLEPLLSYQAQPRFGVSPTALAPIEQVAHLKAPVLVIGGTDDRYTPPAETRALYDAVRGPKRLWWATGADHAAVSHDESPAYRAALLTFLRQAAGRG
ncbi:alpha/beta fold hydrolase [Sphingomonas sp. AR_OL41]|uniref:alpha/beta hydrolase n=1 Tax=Sphingomonas sp. AR_OL41 TaxID=3042729 RepID=UPI00248128BE|nr:alpha/beta fold hydrolase [Sphingomonas sp. AR_OL41]MDH7973943.1 alpha/beta fold hydrolase [Sphingomonas sp. AR_OL41]